MSARSGFEMVGRGISSQDLYRSVMDRANFRRDSWSLASEETNVMKFAAYFCPFDPTSPAQPAYQI
jgi:hypothetical protein